MGRRPPSYEAELGIENLYERAGAALLAEHEVRVRKWRGSSGGCADTSGSREIEAPRPRGATSFGTLAHEVGHIVLHTNNGNCPRWIEETEAWEFALAAVERFELPGYSRVYRDAATALAYSWSKAIRRGVDAETIRDRFPAWWKDVIDADRYGRMRAVLNGRLG